MPIYLGPSDFFEHGGKFYRPGDNVPISKEDEAAMVAHNHRFQNNDPATDTTMVIGPTVAQPPLEPKGDRGEPLEVKTPREGKKTD